MTDNVFNSGLERSFVPDTNSQPAVSIYYNGQIVNISGITGAKLYNFLDDQMGPNQVYPISFGAVTPPSGTNLFYMGSQQPTDVRFYDANGTEKTITAIYLGSTLVWQQ